MHRRDFLRGGCGAALAALLPGRTAPARAHETELLPPIPRINGAINVQPFRRFDENAGLTPPLILPELVDLQMKLLYELGFDWMRVTLSFNAFGPDFLAAIPYVRAARALGVNVLGVIGQFTGFDLVQALSRPATRAEVLDVYLALFDEPVLPASPAIRPGRFAAQILNEPTQFLGIPPDVYVREYLAPAALHLKECDPELLVVSAAAVGNVEGVLRARAMLEAGLERFCDRVAYHIYTRRSIPLLSGMARLPVWVTESGVEGKARHLDWITRTFDEIRAGIPGVEQIFFYQLFDTQPGRFRLVDIVARPNGTFEIAVESEGAYQYLLDRVIAAAGEQAHAAYRDLVPDILLYFPTEEDLRVIGATSYGRQTWRF